jgi:hypothetical protein
MYDYLAQSSDGKPYEHDKVELDKFIDKFKSVIDTDDAKKLSTENFKAYTGGISPEELKYYVQNGKFPINLCVQNYLDPACKVLEQYTKDNATPPLGKTLTYENLPMLWPCRYIYQFLIYGHEYKTQPLSWQIFMGKAKAPTTSITIKSGSTGSNKFF